MIEISETSTIPEVFFAAANAYSKHPFLAAPANPARTYSPPLLGILTSHQTYLFRANNNCFVRNNAHRAILQASRVKSYQFHVQYMCN